MTETTHATILRRMTRAHDHGVAENPLTSSRAVRLALTKAANDAAGLVLRVSSVAEDVKSLDAVLEGLPDGLMLVGLHRQGQLVGLISLDMELRGAVLEIETMGVLSPETADFRPPTQTDKVMCDPLLTQFLSAFPDAVRGTTLEGWGDGIVHDERVADARAAGLLLNDGLYRSVQMDVELGKTDRHGTLIMVLPVLEVASDPPKPADPAPSDWATDFPNVVHDTQASLTALLHRFSVPLATAQQFEVGTVLPLQGCRVSSVKLVAMDEKIVAQAKLGQSGGMRAVRIEAAPLPDMHDLETSTSATQDKITTMPAQDIDLGQSAAALDMAASLEMPTAESTDPFAIEDTENQF